MLGLIRVFIKVVELGSFSKAGAVLNMAPSSVARNIDSLEAELGISLFKRSTRQLLLTEDGEVFLPGANKLLQDANALKASVQGNDVEPEGLIRISAFESFGRLCISPYLPEFLQRYPKLQIEIELDNRVVDLNSENVDLAIRIGQPQDSGLHARLLMSNQTLLCASPEYLALHGEPKTPEDLTEHNCLRLNQDRQKTYWYFQKGEELKKIPVQGNITSKGGTPLLEAAIAGAGLVLLSAWMIDLVKQEKLKVCLPQWQSSLYEGSSGEVYAIYHGSKYPNPGVRALIDFLLEKTEQHLAT